MRIENEFRVPAPLEQVWDYLLDVERVASCMPGAQLTEVVDERTWKGKVGVKMGPVSLSFAGTVVMQERDDEAHRVVLKAEGREQRGKGAATALATSRLEPVDGGTRVVMETDLTITGAVAQYGRGMIADISQRMTKEFAGCLQSRIGEGAAPPAEALPEPTKEAAAPEAPGAAEGESGADVGEGLARETAPAGRPPAAGPQPRQISGLRLGLWALWRAAVRLLRRLVDRLLARR